MLSEGPLVIDDDAPPMAAAPSSMEPEPQAHHFTPPTLPEPSRVCPPPPQGARQKQRESFLRVDWVAVPKALRARRANRWTSAATAVPPGAPSSTQPSAAAATIIPLEPATAAAVWIRRYLSRDAHGHESQRSADQTFAALASQRAWLANLQLRNLHRRFSCQTSDRSAQSGFCAGSTRLGCEALG
jgi:hypothetical protein